MGICKRAVLYLVRKKGKAALLFLIFFFVSAFLLICFSILSGTEQAARELRTNIGAAFYIRPYTRAMNTIRFSSEQKAHIIKCVADEKEQSNKS